MGRDEQMFLYGMVIENMSSHLMSDLPYFSAPEL